MPTEFLSLEQASRYGRYTHEPDPTQLARYFHLDDGDHAYLRQLRGDHNRLGFAVQLGTARYLSVLLEQDQFATVPVGVVRYVASQIDMGDEEALVCLHRYQNKATHFHYVQRIKADYGFREFRAAAFSLTRWLYERAWIAAERPGILFDMATAWMAERRILLPGVTTLERLVARVRDRVSERLIQQLARSLSPEQARCLESLLIVPEGARQSPLDRLRRGPSLLGPVFLAQALRRVKEIRALGVSELTLDDIPAGRIKTLARYVAARWSSQIARMPEQQRHARLLCFARHYEVVALDDALDLLDALLVQTRNRAKATGQRERLRTLRDLDRAAQDIGNALEFLLDEECPEADIRKKTFARIPREKVLAAREAIWTLTRPPDDNFQEELTERYRTMRKFLPLLLEVVSFAATQAGKPVIEALEFLKKAEISRKVDWAAVPQAVIAGAWRRHVFPSRRGSLARGDASFVDHRAYTLCVLEQLHEALRRRDVFVLGSEHWGDPRAKLLSGAAWERARPSVCRVLARENEPEGEIAALARALDETYLRTATNLPQNAALEVNSQGELSLSRLDKLPESPSLLALKSKVEALLPLVDLPELLLEMNLHTGFARAFTHLSERQARVADLELSVCAVLVAEACNVGLEPLIQTRHPALSRDRLEWVMQNYFRAETITRANACLVEAQTQIPLAQAWGGGEVASADGLRFVVPERTIHAGHNRKYFGGGRGITYYNFASDQFTGFHGIVIPGTTHEAPFLLEGLLEQQTTLRPVEVMADSAAYSDVLFGLFYLLGYQFSPRLADIGEARFWRTESTADYGPLNRLAKHLVRTDRIARNWDDLLRIAGSLKMGTISASELIRSLLRSGVSSTMTRALAELGRIPKTLYLLRYLDDEAYRRRILLQLNRHEKRHSLAREVAHGHRGELRKRYREGQEDQLGALGLVVNVIVLWNTLYMNAALNQLRQQGATITDEEVARLWPLRWEHVNLMGRYSFALSETLAPGQLRPLQNPLNPRTDATGDPY